MGRIQDRVSVLSLARIVEKCGRAISARRS
jgi:hypothetical protein